MTLRRPRTSIGAQSRSDFAEMSDAELVRYARTARPGDHRAFAALVRRHQDHVHANCRYLGIPGAEEDLAQGVFIKVHLGLPRFQGRSSFRTWLDRIKANHCFSERRKGRRIRSVEVDARVGMNVGEDALQESIPDQITAKRAVDEALLPLSPTLRAPLVLADMDGFTYKEIAEMLSIGVSAAKMRVMRARAAFRAVFLGEHPEAEGPDRD